MYMQGREKELPGGLKLMKYTVRLMTNSFLCVIIGRIREKGDLPDDVRIYRTEADDET